MVSPGSTWLLTSCLLCLLDLTKVRTRRLLADLLIIIVTIIGQVSGNFLLCHVCGCPGGLDASMEKCSGSCKGRYTFILETDHKLQCKRAVVSCTTNEEKFSLSYIC